MAALRPALLCLLALSALAMRPTQEDLALDDGELAAEALDEAFLGARGAAEAPAAAPHDKTSGGAGAAAPAHHSTPGGARAQSGWAHPHAHSNKEPAKQPPDDHPTPTFLFFFKLNFGCPRAEGACRFSIPLYVIVGLAMLVVPFLLARTLAPVVQKFWGDKYSGDARRLGMNRTELEARIKAATKLGADQRCALLDHFCGSEASLLARAEAREAANLNS